MAPSVSVLETNGILIVDTEEATQNVPKCDKLVFAETTRDRFITVPTMTVVCSGNGVGPEVNQKHQHNIGITKEDLVT